MNSPRGLTISTVHTLKNSKAYYSATLPTVEPMSASSTLIRKTNLHLGTAIGDIKKRYEDEARIVQQNYEVELNNYNGLAKTVEELEVIVEEERRRIIEIEGRLNTAVNDLESERRINHNLEHDNANLKEELRRSHATIVDAESRISRLQQDNIRLDSENKNLNNEIRRLTEAFNARFADLEAKYLTQQRDLTAENERLRNQIEAQRVDFENRLRELEREHSIQIVRVEEKLKERERLVLEFEDELKKMTEHISHLKADYEEEIRRQVANARHEEQQNAAATINNINASLQQSEKDKNALARRNLELAREIQMGERQLHELRAQLEGELIRLRNENAVLRNEVNVLRTANEEFYAENSVKENRIHGLETEISRIQREFDGLNANYSNEVARLVNEQNAERRRFEEIDRHAKGKLAELERILRVSETENDRLRSDLDRIKEQVTGNVHRTIFQTFNQYEATSPKKFYA